MGISGLGSSGAGMQSMVDMFSAVSEAFASASTSDSPAAENVKSSHQTLSSNLNVNIPEQQHPVQILGPNIVSEATQMKLAQVGFAMNAKAFIVSNAVTGSLIDVINN